MFVDCVFGSGQGHGGKRLLVLVRRQTQLAHNDTTAPLCRESMFSLRLGLVLAFGNRLESGNFGLGLVLGLNFAVVPFACFLRTPVSAGCVNAKC